MDIQLLRIEDYDEVWKIWIHTKGMGLNNRDDSREGIRKFLKKNPSTCYVAREEGEILGVILAGNDGRRGYIYHLAVVEKARRKGVATQLMAAAVEALKKEGIKTVASLVFRDNHAGNKFWDNAGFSSKDELVYRSRNVAQLYDIEAE
ncbi:MAG: N-acetyltransferase family protein [Blautia sp.]